MKRKRHRQPVGDIEWWYDPTIWPGPEYPPTFTGTVKQYLDELGSVNFSTANYMTYAFGIPFEEAAERVKEMMEVVQPVAKASAEISKKEKGSGLVSGHGPRSRTTFDRRGNRRY